MPERPSRVWLLPWLLAAAAPAAADDSASAADQDRLVTAQELAAMVSRPADGHAAQDVWSGPNYQVRTWVRLVPGEVELHERVSDIFVVQAGSADMLLGGTIDGGRVTAPGEHRGGTITGGHVRQVGPGDLLWIPVGMPHQVSKVTGGFRYVVIKIVKPD